MNHHPINRTARIASSHHRVAWGRPQAPAFERSSVRQKARSLVPNHTLPYLDTVRSTRDGIGSDRPSGGLADATYSPFSLARAPDDKVILVVNPRALRDNLRSNDRNRVKHSVRSVPFLQPSSDSRSGREARAICSSVSNVFAAAVVAVTEMGRLDRTDGRLLTPYYLPNRCHRLIVSLVLEIGGLQLFVPRTVVRDPITFVRSSHDDSSSTSRPVTALTP